MFTTDLVWAVVEPWVSLVQEDLASRHRGDTQTGLRTDAGQRRSAQVETPRNIMVIPIFGLIEKRSWRGSCSTQEVCQQIAMAVATPSVQGIVLLIDSGGGSAPGTEEAAAVIRAARGRKPVVAVIDGWAGSAAYWLASQANFIILSPSGEAGSIGCFCVQVNVARALKDSGIDVTVVQSTPHKAELANFVPLTAAAQAEMQKAVDYVHARFVRDVAAGRGLPESVVSAKFGQGRMLLSPEALHVGMVDAIAATDQGIRLAADYIGRASAQTRARSHAYQLAHFDPDAAHQKLMALDSKPEPFLCESPAEMKALIAQWEREDRRHAGG